MSAFNDYVRMGRIAGKDSNERKMLLLLDDMISKLRSRAATLEDYSMRLLTSGVYIHGLRKWGQVWPASQLLVVRSEDMFKDSAKALGRVQDFLKLPRAISAETAHKVHNRNTASSRARPSRRLNDTLDGFFAPFNEELYAWFAGRGERFERWPNATRG